MAPGGASRVGHQDLPVLYTPEDDKMAGCGEMSLAHDGHHQLPLAQRVQDALGLAGLAALHTQPQALAALGIREW